MKNCVSRKYLTFVFILLLLIAIVMAAYPASVSAEEDSSDNLAMITVLTHGENYGISVWSDTPEGTFTYNQNSMIENLRINTHADVYIMNMAEQQLILRKVDVVDNSYTFTSVSSINIDVRNLILFEQSNSDTNFQNYYSEFNSAMTILRSTIGEAQKFNLLGISGGGLINMKYAVENPQIIAQIFSIGTPYNGSVLCTYDTAVELLNLNKLNAFIGSVGTLDEIKDNWNRLNNAPSLQTISIGTNSSYFKKLVEQLGGFLGSIASGLLNDLTNLGSLIDLANLIPDIEIDEEKVNDICKIIIKNKDAVEDNIGVHIDSQNAIGYNNATQNTIYFDGQDYDNFTSPASSYSFRTPYISMGGNSKVIAEVCKWLTPNEIVTVSRPEGVFLEKVDIIFDSEWEVPESVNNCIIAGIGSGILNYEETVVETIKIPSTIKYIENGAFSNFRNLNEIQVADNNQNFTSKDGVLYSKNLDILLCYPRNKQGNTYKIDDAAIEISAKAFEKARNLTAIDFSNIEYVSQGAFKASALNNIVSHNCLLAIEKDAFSDTPFYNNNSNIVLDNILIKYTDGIFPSYVKAVSENAVNGQTFTDLRFAENVVINSNAFTDCTIQNIRFEKQATLADFAFFNCDVEQSVFFYSIDMPNIGNNSIISDGSVNVKVASPLYNDFCSLLNNDRYSVDIIYVNLYFDPLADTSVPDTFPVAYYGNIKTLPVVAKSGYDFAGWFTEDGEQKIVEGMVSTFSSDLTLYAHWTPVQYYIAYDLNGGLFVNSDNIVMSYNIESNDIILPVPERDGYTFEGWYTENGQPINTIHKGSVGDIKVLAQWQAKTYTIKLDTCTSEIEFDVEEIDAVYGQTFIIPALPQRLGYQFIGWFDENDIMIANENGIGVLNRSNITTLFAKWEIDTYELRIKCEDNKFVWVVNDTTISSSAAQLNGESIINFINLIDTFKRSEFGYIEGYKFIKFEMDEGKDVQNQFGTSASIDDLSENGERIIYLHAIWDKEVHTIVFNTQVHNKSCPDIIKRYGEEYVLPTEDDLAKMDISIIGYHFGGWYTYTVSGSGVINYGDEYVNGLMPDLTIPQNPENAQDRFNAQSDGTITLIAKWDANEYRVSFNSDGGNAVADTIVEYDAFFGVLPTPARKGYTFKGWTYQNEQITQSTVYKFAYDIELTAEWEVIRYSIAYVSSSFEAIDDLDTSYTVNDEIVLGKAYKLGYKFDGWKDESGQIISVINKNSIGNKTFTATWSANEIKATSNGSPYSISQPYSIVNIASDSSFTIKNTVQQVMFYASTFKPKIKIDIDTRSAALTVIFKNCTLSGNKNVTMIDATNAPELNIVAYGTVTLAAGQNDQNITTAAIKAQKINFYGDGNLSVIGASNVGKNGIHGLNGSPAIIATKDINFAIKEIKIYGGDGSDGSKPVTAANMVSTPSQQTEKGKPGKQGYQGNTGLTGGTGGNGGAAIQGASSVTKISSIKDCYLRNTAISGTVNLYGGNGGDGGEGGKGGKGGRGGTGRDGTLFVYGTEGGKGGTGGTGGNGGNGGEKGMAVLNVGSVSGCVCTNGSTGLQGLKGEGGEGGEGGLGGKKMISGDRYPSGAKGDKGATGLSGRNR